MITHNTTRINLRGVAKAATEANVSRWHVYLCLRGERKPSARVANAIAKYVTFYAAAPERQRICNSVDNAEELVSAHEARVCFYDGRQRAAQEEA